MGEVIRLTGGEDGGKNDAMRAQRSTHRVPSCAVNAPQEAPQPASDDPFAPWTKPGPPGRPWGGVGIPAKVAGAQVGRSDTWVEGVLEPLGRDDWWCNVPPPGGKRSVREVHPDAMPFLQREATKRSAPAPESSAEAVQRLVGEIVRLERAAAWATAEGLRLAFDERERVIAEKERQIQRWEKSDSGGGNAASG